MLNIYVGNLPFTATEAEVQDLFSEHGSVARVSLINDRETGRPRGFGFVEMSDDTAGRAAIEALNALKSAPSKVVLYTDSNYVKGGITNWIHNWKKNGWKTANKKPVKNADLWQALDEAEEKHNVTWRWVKGHAGHPENERADELARDGINKIEE